MGGNGRACKGSQFQLHHAESVDHSMAMATVEKLQQRTWLKCKEIPCVAAPSKTRYNDLAQFPVWLILKSLQICGICWP